MKIIYCILSTYNPGGMERILCDKVNYLIKEMNYEITIITTDQQQKNNFFNFSDKVKFIDLGINYSLNNTSNLFLKIIVFLKKIISHKKRLKQVLIQEKANIVVSMFGNEIYFLSTIKDGSKKIAEVHFSRYFRVYAAKTFKKSKLIICIQFLRTILDKYVVKKFNKLIVLTNEDKVAWGKMKNIKVIYNFVNFSMDDSLSNNDDKIALSVGRLDPQKGFDFLIEAWGIVAQKVPDWQLHIYGSGVDENILKEKINKLKLQDCVYIFPSTQDIGKVYKKSNVYIMSSRYEGLPIVLLEASLYGLPIISFDCPCGPKDIIINNENGILVPKGNVTQLAEQTIKVITNPKLRIQMGSKSKKQSKKFIKETIMPKWIELFESI